MWWTTWLPQLRPRPSWPGGTEVAKAFAGQPSHPVMQALMPLAADFKIENVPGAWPSSAARWT